MVSKAAATRFAFAEKCIDTFTRSIMVLRRLVKDEPSFFCMYTCTGENRRQKMIDREEFRRIVTDDSFYQQALLVLEILRPMKIYLRAFDSDGARISEVLPKTERLREDLSSIEVDEEIFTEERKNEVLNTLESRRDGFGRIQARLIENIH